MEELYLNYSYGLIDYRTLCQQAAEALSIQRRSDANEQSI
jgi:hypothetical protein